MRLRGTQGRVVGGHSANSNVFVINVAVLLPAPAEGLLCPPFSARETVISRSFDARNPPSVYHTYIAASAAAAAAPDYTTTQRIDESTKCTQCRQRRQLLTNDWREIAKVPNGMMLFRRLHIANYLSVADLVKLAFVLLSEA
jgi:hypothetical protein